MTVPPSRGVPRAEPIRAETRPAAPRLGLRRGSSAGNITNCQIGVFAAYVSRYGHAFINRALYLPKGWMNDQQRLAASHVPTETGFSTKPQLARTMIERAIAARAPFAWVAADTVYGVGDIETVLRRAGKGYARGVIRWGRAARSR